MLASLVLPSQPKHNTRLPKNFSMYTRWCFTHNNYTDADIDAYKTLDTKYIVFGKETGSNGTPHLQGFLILKRSQRLSFLRNHFLRLGLVPGHYEPARGTNEQAAEYCKKDGDYFEDGSFPAGAGQRTDLRDGINSLVEVQSSLGRPITTPEAIRVDPVFILKHKNAPTVVRALFEPPTPQPATLRSWQHDLEQELLAPADDRSVLFYVDPLGGCGKTFFCRYMEDHYDSVQFVSSGASKDVAHILNPSKSVFLFNVEKNGMEFLSYRILEQLKDGRVFSPKYSSTVKRWYTNVHVVVFCNELPDLNKLTNDRYVIREYDQANSDFS